MTDQIRVLTVDDSAFARLIIARRLGSDPELKVVGVAIDGVDALAKMRSLRPDVVTLDVEMPNLDGLTTLERIMAECPTPVVMLSRLTDEDTDTTIRALEAGAVDFILKPSYADAGFSTMTERLAEKVKLAAKVDVRRLTAMSSARGRQHHPQVSAPPRWTRATRRTSPAKVVVIGSSTGGPRALHELIPGLPGDIPACILLVQHMPPGFTKSLANRLAGFSQIEVKEAETNDGLRAGLALVAPGDYHLSVSSGDNIRLTREPPRHGLRPAVDVTMEAAARIYRDRCIGVILTGMGSDGRDGATTIKRLGGRVIVQDESTSAVYGMPRSVIEAGYADKVVPLPQMAREILERCLDPIQSRAGA
jgi:two-component system chemotaxis response regulator CheB